MKAIYYFYKDYALYFLSVLNKKHFGIPIMQERVSLLHGDMKIDSSPGNGTKIEISIPLIWKFLYDQ